MHSNKLSGKNTPHRFKMEDEEAKILIINLNLFNAEKYRKKIPCSALFVWPTVVLSI